MTYDLVLRKGKYIKDNPLIIGSIEYEDLPHIYRILKKSDHQVFNKLADIYSDAMFTLEELEQAQDILFELMILDIDLDYKNFIYKLVSIISLVLRTRQS